MLVRLIDGGVSTALEEAGHSLDGKLWTARLLIDDPEAIVVAHLAFLRAGARVIATSSYQASVEGFVSAGVRPNAATNLVRSTTALAVEARRRFAYEDPAGCDDILIAASVGPHGATLGDGSEYGRAAVDEEMLVSFHASRLDRARCLLRRRLLRRPAEVDRGSRSAARSTRPNPGDRLKPVTGFPGPHQEMGPGTALRGADASSRIAPTADSRRTRPQ